MDELYSMLLSGLTKKSSSEFCIFKEQRNIQEYLAKEKVHDDEEDYLQGLMKLTIDKLKVELRARGLRNAGKKNDLVLHSLAAIENKILDTH